jgi:hypothetical protein
MESYGENKRGNWKLIIPKLTIILPFPFFTKPKKLLIVVL